MKWSVAPVVSGVRVRPGPEQERDDLGVAEGARVVEGDEAAVVAGVDIGPGVQQNLHGFPPPITWHRKLYVRCPPVGARPLISRGHANTKCHIQHQHSSSIFARTQSTLNIQIKCLFLGFLLLNLDDVISDGEAILGSKLTLR